MVSLTNSSEAKNGLDLTRRSPDQDKNTLSRQYKLLKKALSSKAIQALYNQACSAPTFNCTSLKYVRGQWSVKFTEKTYSGFKAECDLGTRTISIDKASTDDEALSALVFELIHAINSPQLDIIWAKRCQMGCEDFVKEIKHIEHDGIILHHKVVSKAIHEMGWDKKIDTYADYEQDFEKAWIQTKDSPHAEYYRQAWKKANPGKREPEVRNGCSRTIQKISRFFIEGICNLIS